MLVFFPNVLEDSRVFTLSRWVLVCIDDFKGGWTWRDEFLERNQESLLLKALVGSFVVALIFSLANRVVLFCFREFFGNPGSLRCFCERDVNPSAQDGLPHAAGSDCGNLGVPCQEKALRKGEGSYF